MSWKPAHYLRCSGPKPSSLGTTSLDLRQAETADRAHEGRADVRQCHLPPRGGPAHGRPVQPDSRVRHQRSNTLVQGDPASRPLLFVLGASDSIISLESGESSYADACAAGNPVHMSIYPGLDNSAVLTASAAEALSLQKRFAFATFTTSYTNEIKVPFDLENASRPLDDH